MSTVTVAEVEKALDKTVALTADDAEIQRLIDEAEAEYAEWVLGLPGQSPIASTSVTDRYSGGGDSLYLPAHTSAVTAVTYTDGTTIDVNDLSLNTRTGLLSWDYGTVGYFTRGIRNLSITFTLGPLPANHKGAIIADVAGYFAANHRGALGLLTPDGEPANVPFVPGVLYPRVRALAPPSVA